MSKERFIERIPAGALRSFDEQMDQGADLRALRKLSEKGTKRFYRIKFANYQRWCASVGYQTDVVFITDACVEEYVRYLVSPDERAAPSTINQAISALAYYAERAAVSPMPSMRPARNVLKAYKAKLKRRKLVD